MPVGYQRILAARPQMKGSMAQVVEQALVAWALEWALGVAEVEVLAEVMELARPQEGKDPQYNLVAPAHNNRQ